MTAALEVVVEPYDGPAGRALVAAVQGEYVERYGGPDETVVDPAEFAPPRGLFLIGRQDGEPVACGGFRLREGGGEPVAELKRMYVVPAARGRGHARALLAALEEAARRAGATQVWLETGSRQPEAIALYASSGYGPVAAFGHYACAPESVHLGKRITP